MEYSPLACKDGLYISQMLINSTIGRLPYDNGYMPLNHLTVFLQVVLHDAEDKRKINNVYIAPLVMKYNFQQNFSTNRQVFTQIYEKKKQLCICGLLTVDVNRYSTS